MKKCFLFIIVLLSLGHLSAQDVIVLRDATEIEAQVLTVGVDEISYKKWDFQDGPVYQIPKANVFFIKYANGSKDVFAIEEKTNDSPIETTKGKFIHRTLFNVYAEAGCPFRAYEAGPALHFTFGARIRDYVFVGMMTGVDALFVSRTEYRGLWDGLYVPFLANVRCFYPAKENVYPYLEASLGFNLMIANGMLVGADYLVAPSGRFRFGAGFEWKRLTLGMGYDCVFLYGGAVHTGYAKIGVRIGKLK